MVRQNKPELTVAGGAKLVHCVRMRLEKNGLHLYLYWIGYFLGLGLEVFSRAVEGNCGLVLQRTKTEVFSWEGRLPAGTPPDLVRAGNGVAGQWEAGMTCYGVPVGSDNYVQQMLEEKVFEVAREVETVCSVLQEESQALWTVLRSSISQKLDYWLTLVYPSQVRAAAERMDRLEMEVVKRLLGMHIPMQGEQLGWDCLYSYQ